MPATARGSQQDVALTTVWKVCKWPASYCNRAFRRTRANKARPIFPKSFSLRESAPIPGWNEPARIKDSRRRGSRNKFGPDLGTIKHQEHEAKVRGVGGCRRPSTGNLAICLIFKFSAVRKLDSVGKCRVRAHFEGPPSALYGGLRRPDGEARSKCPDASVGKHKGGGAERPS